MAAAAVAAAAHARGDERQCPQEQPEAKDVEALGRIDKGYALAQAEHADGLDGRLPVGAVLQPDAGLWLEALQATGSGTTARAPEITMVGHEGIGTTGEASRPRARRGASGTGGGGRGSPRDGPSRRAKRRNRGTKS